MLYMTRAEALESDLKNQRFKFMLYMTRAEALEGDLKNMRLKFILIKRGTQGHGHYPLSAHRSISAVEPVHHEKN